MTPPPRAPFPLLEITGYVPAEWDLSDAQRRAYWVTLFRTHLRALLTEAILDEAAAGVAPEHSNRRATEVEQDFSAFLDAATEEPSRYGRLDVLTLCVAREQSLRRFGFADPYRSVKARENDLALPLLPDVLRELDSLEPAPRWQRIIEGVFAGNIFDLGATQTAKLFDDGKTVDFRTVRNGLRPRPWCVDNLDTWLARMHGPSHESAVLFVDNAGPDIVLGMLPFARELLRRGTRVLLTANATPSLNDITHEELTVLLDSIRHLDTTIDLAVREGRLSVVSSGNATPLIDLASVSAELAHATRAQGTDLVVLEGMGRAVESNFSARFSCDCVKLAMLKDPDVAAFAGGEIHDLVFRFDPAP